MTDLITLLALFPDVEPAADAIDQLRLMGIDDDEMNIISGIPVTEAMLGRPHQTSNVPRLAMGGSIAGFMIGVFFAYGTPNLYPVSVGGQAFIPGPPTVVVLFEMTMLGMLIATFLGVFLDSRFPFVFPKEYVPEISDGKIAVLFACPEDAQSNFIATLTALGAESVNPAEAVHL